MDIISGAQFSCCRDSNIATLRCPKCRHLLGCCRNCRMIYYNLQDLSKSYVINLGSPLICEDCNFNFLPTVDWEQFLAEPRDLIKANLETLSSEQIEFRPEPRKEADEKFSKADFDRIYGWKFYDRVVTRQSLIEWLAENYLYILLLLLFVAAIKGLSLYLNQISAPLD